MCDITRFINEFYLKSYASIKQEDVRRIFGTGKNTKKALEKIDLLFALREIRNKTLKHIKYVIPVTEPPNKP
jgi:hypothetical protein